MEKKSVFHLTICQEVDRVTVHATHCGEKSIVLELGMSLLDCLSGDDSGIETKGVYEIPPSAWMQ